MSTCYYSKKMDAPDLFYMATKLKIFFFYFPADSWPQVFDDSEARRDWNWKPEVDLDQLVRLMVKEVKEKIAANGF